MSKTSIQPIKTKIVKGKLPPDHYKTISLSDASDYLEISDKKLYLNIFGSRSFLSFNKETKLLGRSYYYSKFYQGATIVPQSCWFVDIIDDFGEIVTAKTSKRAKIRGKIDKEISKKPIEREFIYKVLMGSDVLPFCHLDPSNVVLPLISLRDKYFVLKKHIAKQRGKIHLIRWLEEVETIWGELRGEKKGKMDIYDRINYQRLLEAQNPHFEYMTVYLTSATHISSCVLKTPVIVESTLYRCTKTSNEDEAFYLAAILNSPFLDGLIKPMQAKGFSDVARHIHKKPFEFPIQKYSPDEKKHKFLSDLGKEASQIAVGNLQVILSDLGYDDRLSDRGTLLPIEIANLRTHLREYLKEYLEKIDDILIELLTESSISKRASLTSS